MKNLLIYINPRKSFDKENDILAKISGKSPAILAKLGRNARTLFEVISVFAPKEDGNDPVGYSKFIA